MTRDLCSRWIALLVVTLFSVSAAPAGAQIDPGRWYLSPGFGFSGSSQLSSGVNFGFGSTYMLNPEWSIGPFLEFTTAGRVYETGNGPLLIKTESSNTWILGMRGSYHFSEGSETTWRLHLGGAWMRQSSIDTFRDGTRLIFETDEFEILPGEIPAETSLAATFGIGTFLPMSDVSRIALDLNFYGSTIPDPVGVTVTGKEVEIRGNVKGGAFWLTQVTIGFHLGR